MRRGRTMLRRWALAAALLACLGAGLSVRAASAEDVTFSAPVTGMGNWLFEGPLDIQDGKFQQTFVSGNARLQVWGSIDGDHVSMGGQVKVTGFYEQGNAFRIEGKFRDETFNGNFVETLNYGQALRGKVTMTRPVAKAAPAPAAPAQQAVVSTPKQTTTPPAQQTTQPAPAAPTPESLEPKLNAAQRQGVQKQLTTLGFYNRAIDGGFGPGTRDAIRRFQQAYDLPQTGYLDAKEIRILKEAAVAKEKEIAVAAAQQAEEQATAKKLADEKAAEEKAEADRKAADAQAQAAAEQLAKDRQALEAQKAELKRQQEELAKKQRQAEAPKEPEAP